MKTTNRIKISLSQNKYQLLLLAIYSILTVFFCSKMSPLYPINEWADVNLYFNVAKAMVNGQVLYLDIFDHKGPLVFFLYAIGYIISNDSFIGMFIIECFAWIILTFTAYYTAKMFLDRAYSFLVAIAFLPFFISHTEQGGSVEEFMAVCIAISLYLFIRYFRNPQRHNYRFMVVHGMMWAIVLSTKFTLTAFWIPSLIAIGIILLYKKEYKNLCLNIISFLIGGAIVSIPLLVYFLLSNSLDEAYNAYVTMNLSSVESSITLLVNIIVRFYQRLRFETVEFSILLIGAIGFPIVFIRNNIAKVGLAFSFFALYAIIFIGAIHRYYPVPYYVYGIPAFTVIAYYFGKYIRLKFVWHLAVILSTIALCISIGRKDYFNISGAVLTRKEKPVGVMFQFKEVIEKENNPTLLNLGHDDVNAVFTMMNIVPNVRYFLTPNLQYERYPQMRDEQSKYIEEKRVKFISLSSLSRNFDYFRSFEPLSNNYEVIDIYDYTGCGWMETRTIYLYRLKE